MPPAIALAIPAILGTVGTAAGTTAGASALAAAGLTAGQAAALGGGLSAAGTLGSGLSSFLNQQGLPNITAPPAAASTSGSSAPVVPNIPGNTPGVGLVPSFGNLTGGTAGSPTGRAAVGAALSPYGGNPSSGDPYGGGFD